MSRTETAFRLIVPCLLAASAAGCGGGQDYDGPQRAAVTGAVTLDGQPLPSGTIDLIGAGGGEARNASGTVENGVYKIPEPAGPTFGKYKVEIRSYQTPPDAATRPGLDADQRSALTKQVVPAKFNTNTTLEIDVDSPEVTKDFPLTSK